MNQEKTKKTLKIIAFILRIVAAIFGRVGEKHLDKHAGNDATDGKERKALPAHDERNAQ